MYFDRACIEKALGNHKDAIIDYTKAIELNPNDADAFSGRAYSRAALQDYEIAMNDAMKALKINCDHIDALKLTKVLANINI